MKFILSVMFLFVAVAAVMATELADAGHFIPKAVYTLDSEGHKSNLHPINQQYVKRLRRQIFSSSSSSSSVTNDGGPTYFSSHQSVQQSPGGVDFASRFGEVGVAGYNGHGEFLHTAGVIDNTGKIVYKTEKGHF